MTQQEINEWAIAIGFLIVGFLMNLLYERSRRLEHRVSEIDRREGDLDKRLKDLDSKPTVEIKGDAGYYMNSRAVPRMAGADLAAIAKRTDAKQFKNFSDFRKSMESEDVA